MSSTVIRSERMVSVKARAMESSARRRSATLLAAIGALGHPIRRALLTATMAEGCLPPADQAVVPGQQCARGDEAVSAQRGRQLPSECREHRAVGSRHL